MEIGEYIGILQTMIGAAADAMLLAAPDGRIRAANAAAARLFGRAAPELRSLKIDDLVPDRFRSAHRDHRQHYDGRARGMGSRRCVRGLRADGAEFLADVSLGPVGNGTPALWVNTWRIVVRCLP